jgi:WD40 repeat protein
MVSVGGELARRRVYFSELEYPEPENRRVKEVIKRFDAARLLTSDKDDEGRPYVEPAHDVLVRGWQKLSDWKQQGLANLLLQRDLTPTANEWTNSSKKGDSRGLLWDDDPRLLLAMQLLCGTVYKDTWFNFWKWIWGDKFWKEKSNNFWLNSSEQTFVVDSFEQKNTKRRNTLGIASGVFTTLLGLTLWAINNANIAENRRINAEVRADNLYWKGLMDANTFNIEEQIAVIEKARQWQSHLDELSEDSRLELLATLYGCATVLREKNRFEGYHAVITSVAFSPDGKWVVIGGKDKTAKLWSFEGKLIKAFPHDMTVTSVAFSPPDGKTILTGSDDGTAKLWSIEGKPIQSFPHQNQKAITSVAFSPDGKNILTGSVDGTAKLWSIDGQLIHLFIHHTFQKRTIVVYGVAFSPDGKNILTAGEDEAVKLWSIDGELVHTFVNEAQKRYENSFTSVTFSPNNKTILAGSFDNSAKLWSRDITCRGDRCLASDGSQGGGQLLHRFRHRLGRVWSVAFSPDNKIILTGSDDKTAKLWINSIGFDDSGNLLQTLQGHKSAISTVAFSLDGKSILTGSPDTTAKLWGIDERLVQNLRWRDYILTTDNVKIPTTIDNVKIPTTIPLCRNDDKKDILALSPGGKVILTGCSNIAKLWDLNGRLLYTFRWDQIKNSRHIKFVGFGKDGNSILTSTASSDHSYEDDLPTRLWSLKLEKSLSAMCDHLRDFAAGSMLPEIPEESRNLRQRAKNACEGIPPSLSALSLTGR